MQLKFKEKKLHFITVNIEINDTKMNQDYQNQ